jgi:hypothetical protein
MKEPKVTFKNLKTFEGMEGIGINADVYINGVKCLFIKDGGDGGEMDFDEYIHGKNPELVVENIKLLNDYVDQLPKEKWELGDTVKYFKVKLDDYLNKKIDEILNAKEIAKLEKKMNKLFLTAIVFGVPNTGKISYLDYKRDLSTFPEIWLKQQIANVQKKYCIGEVQILNTNLKELLSN